MRRRNKELEIAEALRSPETAECQKGIASFVRLFTFSAPTEIAQLAASQTHLCASYCGDGPLVDHLLGTLVMSDEVRLAWGIALLKGEALSRQIGVFHHLFAEPLRRFIASRCPDAADALQDFALRLLTREGFRRSCFGKYSGEGGLVAYLGRFIVREGVREMRRRSPSRHGRDADVLEGLPQRREASPERAAHDKELRAQLADAFRQFADDPGFTSFLLQQGFNMTPAAIADILRLEDNAVRQRLFRFRERFREFWRRAHAREDDPFPDPAEATTNDE